jgi:hypothetical protein
MSVNIEIVSNLFCVNVNMDNVLDPKFSIFLIHMLSLTQCSAVYGSWFFGVWAGVYSKCHVNVVDDIKNN